MCRAFSRSSSPSSARLVAPGAASALPCLVGAVTAVVLAAAALASSPAAAQDVLDRSPNLTGGWIGLPWTLHVQIPSRFRDADPGDGIDLLPTSTFTGALGLPHRSVAGLSYASLSPTAPGQPDEVELFARHRLIAAHDGIADVGITAAWNTAAGSFDAEASAARWFGPLRLLAAARWFSDARGLDDRAALGAGAVWHPLARAAPLALAADVVAPLDDPDGQDPAWSVAVQAGIPHTALTLSLMATNAGAATLQGSTFADGPTRYGFEVTIPIPIGYLVGGYPARERAMESVEAEPGAAADAVVEIRLYDYEPDRIVVPAGSVVEWVNRDEVVHTATAEDGAWDSGAIRPGASWRARFDEPGVYPYYCGPHPFMTGVVIVR